MTTLRYMALLSLGIAFCLGCGDSSTQSWESGKPRASGEKPLREKGVQRSMTRPTTMAPEPPMSPTIRTRWSTRMAAMNPHGGMQMPAGESEAKLENTGKLDIETVHFTVPKSWVRKAPNPMLLAEFAIPRAEGDKDDGRLTVSQAGGTLEANINRWKGQFGKKLDKENQETIDVGGIKVTLVDFSGTFDDSRGMMGPTVTVRTTACSVRSSRPTAA